MFFFPECGVLGTTLRRVVHYILTAFGVVVLLCAFFSRGPHAVAVPFLRLTNASLSCEEPKPFFLAGWGDDDSWSNPIRSPVFHGILLSISFCGALCGPLSRQLACQQIQPPIPSRKKKKSRAHTHTRNFPSSLFRLLTAA